MATAIHPSSRQTRRNARRLTQRAPKPTHTLMEWVDTAVCTLRVNVGEPRMPGANGVAAALTQMARELGMRQSLCNPSA